MTYLIFGDKGYVASNIINYLKKKQEKYIKISANSDPHKNKLDILLKNIYLSLDNFDENSCHQNIDLFIEEFKTQYPKTLINLTLIPTGLCHKIRTPYSEMTKINFKLPFYYSLIAMKLNSKKIIYLSSAGLYLNAIQPITDNSPINTDSYYKVTKYLTELEIQNYLLKNPELKTSLFILRPTIIYGNSPKGSFGILEKIVNSGIPVPISKYKFYKSMLYIGNLIKVIERIYELELKEKRSINKILLCDDDFVSVEEILKWIGLKTNKKIKVIKLNRLLSSLIKKIYPLNKLFFKLNSKHIYNKSKIAFELLPPMPSKIKEDINNL